MITNMTNIIVTRSKCPVSFISLNFLKNAPKNTDVQNKSLGEVLDLVVLVIIVIFFIVILLIFLLSLKGDCLELFLFILVLLIFLLVFVKFLLSLKCYGLELFLFILVFLVIEVLIFLKVLLFLSLEGSSLKLFLLIFLFLLFFLILLCLIDLSLLIKVLYGLLSGLDLLSIVRAGEEVAQGPGGAAGHGDKQEGQEVSQHLHGGVGVVVAVGVVSSGSDLDQLV